MSRRAHYIKPNNSTEYPNQAIWFDTETTLRLASGETISLEDWKSLTHELDLSKRVKLEVTQHLRVGYACYLRKHRDNKWSDETWIEFTTRSEFWAFVCSKVRTKTKLFLFCHNTGFDLPVLDMFHELPKLGWTLKSAIIDAPPTICKWTRNDCSIVVIDTLNFWRMPLEKLGKSIGLHKLTMPLETATKQEWETYARRDVEIIRDACLNWWQYLETNDMGGFMPTLASQSMALFRHKYMKHRIFIDTNTPALELTREGYYGGRTEAFRIGHYRGEFYYIDVNAMYPAVMHEKPYPLKLIGCTHYATKSDLITWLKDKSITARVLLRTDKPFAPVRTKNKLIFPVGTFECILSSPEIQYALDHAEILEVRQVAVYNHDYIFTTMMEDMQRIRAKYIELGDEVNAFQTKILNNSLYGKTGQSGIKWQENSWTDDLECKQWIEYDMETRKIIQHRQLGGLIQVKQTQGESRESFPAIAGHVCAYARMKLWYLIEQAGIDNVYYCDTDSLVLSSVGYERLKDECHASRMGAYKLVGTYTDIEIKGAKDYRFGNETKTKGIRKDAVWLDGWTVSQEQWSGLRGLVRDNTADAPHVKKIVKRMTRIYSKGVVSTEGLVSPHRLNLSTLAEAHELV